MSKEDIDKAVRDAEKFAEEDKKQKEAVEVRNRAENTIFQIEKSVSELGDKVTEEDKAPVNAAIEKLKETLKGTDVEAIKADTEAVEKAFYPIAEKIYKEQAAQGNANGAGQQADDGTVYDTDFEDKT